MTLRRQFSGQVAVKEKRSPALLPGQLYFAIDGASFFESVDELDPFTGG
jgi:hypothetical protein